MSHFAELDENNIVLRVVVGNNEDPNGDEGYQWIIDNLGGRWIQTSYSASMRKNFAGVGFFYDDKLDAFIPPKPFTSWLLDGDTCQWIAPLPYPNDGAIYYWNETAYEWQPFSPTPTPIP